MQLGVAASGFARHVTLADVNLKFIWHIVSSIDVGGSGTAFVVDAAGNLIAHPDLSLVLARTNFANTTRVQSAIAELRLRTRCETSEPGQRPRSRTSAPGMGAEEEVTR